MKRWLVVIATALVTIVAYLLGAGSSSHPAAAAAPVPSTAGIVVDGSGHTSGTPDTLRATFGISLSRPDVSQVLAEAAVLSRRVGAALRRDGVLAKDLQTSQINVFPSYNSKGVRTGYQVDDQVTAKLHDLPHAGRTLSDALLAGGSAATLGGLSFSLEDNVALVTAARTAAFAEAKSKAQQYADLAGRSLGDVQTVSESSSAPLEQVPMRKLGAFASADALPVDPGTASLEVAVTVRWSMR